MNKLLNSYFENRQDQLYLKISSVINRNTLDEIANNIFRDNFIAVPRLVRGHEYYLEVTKQITLIKRQHNFMHTFKRRYGLQYIDRTCLDTLERKKNYIITNIVTNPFKIYNDFFARACIIENGVEKHKRLTSFFTKLAHTISPSKFSALDNPIRHYFEINNESFIVSYGLLNETYSKWLKTNHNLLLRLRRKISAHDQNNILELDSLENLKLLDMIFWFKANRENNS